jgi:hypothetical protein
MVAPQAGAPKRFHFRAADSNPGAGPDYRTKIIFECSGDARLAGSPLRSRRRSVQGLYCITPKRRVGSALAPRWARNSSRRSQSSAVFTARTFTVARGPG